MPESESIGRKIVGIITDARGVCAAGHKVGDQFELSGYTSDGLCGYFYHDIFPYVVMLEFGGGFPEEYGDPDVIKMECPDKANPVGIELRRLPE